MTPFGEAMEDDSSVVFRDVITLALGGFVAALILVLPWVNPKGASEAEGAVPPGNVIIETYWPDTSTADVDQWVQGPGDVPVGYSNKGGGLFNLLRDDLGHVMDVSGRNYETSFSRGVLPGEYTVNLHAYRGTYPLTAKVVVSVRPTDTNVVRQIIVTDATLQHSGQEITVARWKLDDAGALVAGSLHHLPKPLRSGAKT
jgi:hypothetical protein